MKLQRRCLKDQRIWTNGGNINIGKTWPVGDTAPVCTRYKPSCRARWPGRFLWSLRSLHQWGGWWRWGPLLHPHNSAGISKDDITVTASYRWPAWSEGKARKSKAWSLTSIPFIQRLAMMESSPQTMMWNSKEKMTQVETLQGARDGAPMLPHKHLRL